MALQKDHKRNKKPVTCQNDVNLKPSITIHKGIQSYFIAQSKGMFVFVSYNFLILKFYSSSPLSSSEL